MERYYNLLKSWCDRLIELQLTELKDPRFYGGIMCPACAAIHGRIGDAVYPFTFLYDKTGEVKYLNAARLVVEWSEQNVLRNNGGYFNDKTSSWQGITVFSMIAMGDALLYHGDCLDSDTYSSWMAIFKRLSEFVYQFFASHTIRPNINYYAAECHGMALAYVLTGVEKYKERAYMEAAYVKGFFTEDGLLMGESHNKNPKGSRADCGKRRTEGKNCCFVDIGYNVEESLPSLISYACLMDDEETLGFCAEKFKAHLEFMLPDGAWDNSWGGRADKWTYWGSRTSDGAQIGLCLLAKYDPVFGEAAQRNFELYEKCSADGYLYGGRMYIEAGEDPCTHHAFCHAKALCAMMDSGFVYKEICKEKSFLPREVAYGVRNFPSVHVNLIAKGDWRATVSDDDAVLPGTGKGTSGGTVTMLWNNKVGPVFAATMAQYRMAEPRNMQYSRYDNVMPSGALRISDGVYESVNDICAVVTVEEQEKGIRVEARGTLKNIEFESAGTGYQLEYLFESNRFTVKAKADKDCKLRMPVICSQNDAVVVRDQGVRIERNGAAVMLWADQPMFIEKAALKRSFHVIGGFQTLPVYVELKAGMESRVVVEIQSSSLFQEV